MNPKTWWYVARAAGMMSWWLCGASILLGLVLAGRMRRRPTPAWQLDLHRFLGGLGIACLGLHVVALGLDPTVQFPLAALTVPMTSAWRPGAVAWGVVTAYLVLVIEVSSLLRPRLPRRLWRGIHLTSFAVWITGSVHALTAGTDQRLVRIAAFVGTAAIFNLGVARIVSRRMPRARRTDRPAAPTRSASASP
jgi:hypothetical protein